VVLAGTIAPPDLNARQRAHLEQTGALLWMAPDGDRRDLLVVRVESRGRTADAVVTVDYRRLFGLDGWDVLPPGAALCVFSTSRQMTCSQGVETETAEAVARAGSDASLTIASDSGPLLAQTWPLPLQPSFGPTPGSSP
jgi:hypothetical protein